MIRTEERTASRVETTVTGTLDECLKEIRNEIGEYPPLGYGTKASLHYEGISGVQFVARIRRMASCD